MVILWSICGHFVVFFRSITGRREYGTVPTRLPACPSIQQNEQTHTVTQSMIAILQTEDAEARIIATKCQRPLVSWRRRFTCAASAGEPRMNPTGTMKMQQRRVGSCLDPTTKAIPFTRRRSCYCGVIESMACSFLPSSPQCRPVYRVH